MNITCYTQICKLVETLFLLTPDFYTTAFPIEIISTVHY